MRKYHLTKFILFVFIILHFQNHFGQNLPYAKKEKNNEYLYCINGSIPFSVKVGFPSRFFYTYTDSINDQIMENLKLMKYDHWVSSFFLFDTLDRWESYRSFVFRNGRLDTFMYNKQDVGFYNGYGHIRSLCGDIFIIRRNNAYFYDSYLCHHGLSEMPSEVTMVGVDSTLSSQFKVFRYAIAEYPPSEGKYIKKEPFLYISFCPQIGIIEYQFETPKHIKMILESVNGFPIDYFMKNNICTTLFCGGY